MQRMETEEVQGVWMAFQQCLIDSEAILKKNKVNTETEEWLLTTLVYPTKEPSHYKNI